MKRQIAQLLSKPMDRKEFLRFTGASLLLIIGGGLIVQALGLAQKNQASSGYSSNDYGE